MANKIHMNKKGNTMYLAGNNGTNVVSVKGENVKKNGPTRKDRRGITVRGGNDGHMMLHEPNSNNLTLYDSNFNAVRKLDGNFEEGTVSEHFNDYRYSLDDIFFLWRSGNNGITIVEAETFEKQETIDNFFTYKGMPTSPIAACANRVASKICGTSKAGPNEYILHYYEDNMDGSPIISYSKPVSSIIPSMVQVTCMDVSYDEMRIYIAGMAILEGRALPIVVACGFDPRFPELSAKLLKDLPYGTPHRLNKHFTFLECKGGQLSQIGSIPDVHKNEICDFEVRDNYLYSKAYGEPVIKVTQLNGGDDLPPKIGINEVYRNVRTNQVGHNALDGLEKIVATNNGDRVYAGGKGLHILDRKNGSLVPTDLDAQKSKFWFLNFLKNF